jgi:hypothetical protein
VGYAGEPDRSTVIGHAIFDFKMARLHSHAHAETVDREHATFADGRFDGTRDLR